MKPGTRKNNRQRLEEFYSTNVSLTQREAAHNGLEIYSLSQEISRMEADGWIFKHIREEGDGTHWTRYVLVFAPPLKFKFMEAS